MAAGEEKSDDFYAVLGLKKECTPAELRTAYKKLALKWHPDRCSALGNSKYVEEAKKKFQAIQQAYSVLSDANKRFLYDVGVYDCDDEDDENGMGDFLNEMAAMMTQNKSNETREETFEELQGLFEEMFQSDIESFIDCPSRTASASMSSSSFEPCRESYFNVSNKRNSSEMSSGSIKPEATKFGGFCIGVCILRFLRLTALLIFLFKLFIILPLTVNNNFPDRRQVKPQANARRGNGAGERTTGRGGSSRRDGRKQKVSFGHDVSSNEYANISA